MLFEYRNDTYRACSPTPPNNFPVLNYPIVAFWTYQWFLFKTSELYILHVSLVYESCMDVLAKDSGKIYRFLRNFCVEDWFSLTIIFFWLGRRWLGICKMFSACMVFVLYLSLIVVNYLTVSAFPSVGTKDAVWTHLQTFFVIITLLTSHLIIESCILCSVWRGDFCDWYIRSW